MRPSLFIGISALALTALPAAAEIAPQNFPSVTLLASQAKQQAQPLEIENVQFVVDGYRGPMLVGDLYNPNSTPSAPVTLYYWLDTTEQYKTGTMAVGEMSGYRRERFELEINGLRGEVQDFAVEHFD